MSRFKVGDIVALSCRRDTVEEIITRVGRKYVYITRWGREHGFDIETGYEKDDRYGISDRIYTKAEWTQKHYRQEVCSALMKRHNLSPDRGSWKQSLPVLEKMLALLDGEAAQ